MWYYKSVFEDFTLERKYYAYKGIIKKQLTAMGLTGEETILIHSSMKAIGETQKGADTVLDALMEFFEKGLLLLPTHTWKTINAENPVFDVDNEPACVGILPNLFLKRHGVVRSLHPTHSMAGFGKMLSHIWPVKKCAIHRVHQAAVMIV